MSDENKVFELPKFTALVNKNKAKKCRCYPKHYIIDYTNREVTCAKCGNFVDPYDALWTLAQRPNEYTTQFNYMKEKAEAYLKNKRHLIILRKIEEHYQRGTMRPFCPHCNKPFDLSDLNSWTSKEFANAILKKLDETKQNNR